MFGQSLSCSTDNRGKASIIMFVFCYISLQSIITFKKINIVVDVVVAAAALYFFKKIFWWGCGGNVHGYN